MNSVKQSFSMWLMLRKKLFFIFILCFGIMILRLGGKNCVVKNEKWIFPKSQFVNSNPKRFYLYECPGNDLIYSLYSLSDISCFISVGSAFHIFGPKIFKLLSLYVTVLWLLTSKSCGSNQASCLLVRICFIKLGFKLLNFKYFYC